jgi:hypothetical protein
LTKNSLSSSTPLRTTTNLVMTAIAYAPLVGYHNKYNYPDTLSYRGASFEAVMLDKADAYNARDDYFLRRKYLR